MASRSTSDSVRVTSSGRRHRVTAAPLTQGRTSSHVHGYDRTNTGGSDSHARTGTSARTQQPASATTRPFPSGTSAYRWV